MRDSIFDKVLMNPVNQKESDLLFMQIMLSVIRSFFVFLLKMNLLRIFLYFMVLLVQMLSVTSKKMQKFCKENSCKKCADWFMHGKDINLHKRHKKVILIALQSLQ